MKRFKKYVFYFCLLTYGVFVHAKPIAQDQIPQLLHTWEDWVLYDVPQSQCPFLYQQQEDRYCAWPTHLLIDVQSDKMYFKQSWQVFSSSIIALPGDAQLWPQQVQVNGQYYPITEHEKTPVIALDPGMYEIQGVLPYSGVLPEMIKIPNNTGLVQLSQQGIKVNHPRLDDAGYLWLQYADNSSNAASMQLRVFRKVTQAVPMEILTVLELEVGGPAREVQLGPVLLPGTIAMRLDSSLPAQLDENGVLRVQLRSGKWQIEITERYPGSVELLKRAEVGPPWPAEEIWSFALDSRLGAMTISGVPSVDPTQTLMPQEWRDLPAYRVLVASPVLLNTSHVANATENQLSLMRHMWLDFSGTFWTVSDTLQGEMISNWRLSLEPPFLLGQFSLNNAPQLVTTLENAQGEQIPGVEVREGQLNASAESLVKNTWRMPITGWSDHFTDVHTTLWLPPGWQLVTAFGVDEITGSIFSQWSLFDVFIVLLIAIAMASVLGNKWGFLGFVMLLLTYHQGSAPVFIWLNLILALWAVQWCAKARWCFILKIYRDLSFALLAIMIVWISAASIVKSLYPQISTTQMHTQAQLQEPVPEYLPEGVQADQRLMLAKPMSKEMQQPNFLFAVPVDAKTQTGPAKPQWEWTQVQMDWPLAVKNDNQVYLFLISPLIARVLTMLQIILFVALALQLWQMRTQKLQFKIEFAHRKILLLPLWALLISSVMHMPAQAQEIPSPELLNTLKSRLLAPEDCLPQCASIGSALINVNADEVMISLQIDALAPVAIPIPGRSAYWQAEQVFVNQVPATALSWHNDTLMVQLNKGHHTVMVYGRANHLDKLSFDFPLNPHWLEVSAPGWFVEGLDNQQLSGNMLHLLRREQNAQNEFGSAIQPFVRVVRNLSLGLTGEVTTRVERISPVTGAIALNIPLLAHESVLTQGIMVKDNQAQISFAPHQREVTWQSTLSDFNDLTLLAPETSSWVEEWQVRISPIWHPSITGILPLYESQYDVWQSQWQPWPTQSVHIQLTRLPAMVGSTLTIDQVSVNTHAGARGTQVSMQALLRSTLGGQHTLLLPQNAQVDDVRVNGMPQGAQNNNQILLSYGPGDNWVDMEWHTLEPISVLTRTPILDWNMPAYNINLGLNIPADRWVLALGGAGYGPAILYWIWAIGAIVLAVALGKMTHTQLSISQWCLLLLGLSLLTPFLGLWVVVALVLCSLYDPFIKKVPKKLQRLVQVILGILIMIAIVILVQALILALRATPDMHIIPSSLGAQLHADYVWLQDFSMDYWPRAFVVSVPLWIYRGLMLLWALWVVFTVMQLVMVYAKRARLK